MRGWRWRGRRVRGGEDGGVRLACAWQALLAWLAWPWLAWLAWAWACAWRRGWGYEAGVCVAGVDGVAGVCWQAWTWLGMAWLGGERWRFGGGEGEEGMDMRGLSWGWGGWGGRGQSLPKMP